MAPAHITQLTTNRNDEAAFTFFDLEDDITELVGALQTINELDFGSIRSDSMVWTLNQLCRIGDQVAKNYQRAFVTNRNNTKV